MYLNLFLYMFNLFIALNLFFFFFMIAPLKNPFASFSDQVIPISLILPTHL